MSDPWQGLCTDDPDSWDLDSGDVKRWLRAIRMCRESCPFLAECAAARTRMYPATADVQFSRSMPSGVIWAGIAYSDAGYVLSLNPWTRVATDCVEITKVPFDLRQ